MSPLEREVASLIIETIGLEDVAVKDINPTAPLFREGLGLDSIDALEISLVISQRYGFQIKADDDNNIRVFASLRSLSQHIESHQVKAIPA